MAAGIDAEVSIPNFKAKKAFAVARTNVKTIAMIMTLNVSSDFCAIKQSQKK